MCNSLSNNGSSEQLIFHYYLRNIGYRKIAKKFGKEVKLMSQTKYVVGNSSRKEKKAHLR